MPTIPVYNAQKNVTSNPRSAPSNIAEPVGQQVDKNFQQVLEMEQRWSDAQDLMQASQAKANLAVKIAEIKSRADSDSGITLDKNGMPVFSDNTPKYLQEIEQAKSESLKSISNKQVANNLSIDFDVDKEIAGIEISNGFKQKMIANNAVAVQQSVLDFTSKMLSDNPSVRSRARQDRDNFLTSQVSAGLISPQQKQKLEDDSLQTVMEYKIANETSTSEDDSVLLQDLKDGSQSGKYHTLNPDMRLELIKKVQYRISQNALNGRKNMIHSQLEGRINFLKGVSSGAIDPNDASTIQQISQSDPNFANILETRKKFGGGVFMIQGGKSGIISANSFVQLVEKIYQQGDEESLNKFIETTVSQLGNKSSDLTQLGVLTDAIAKQSASLRPSPENVKQVEDHNLIKKSVEAIKKILPNLSPQATMDFLIRSFLNKSSGESIELEKKKSIKDTINKAYPKTLILPGVPNKVYSPDEPIESIYEGPNELNGEEYVPSQSSESSDFTRDESAGSF